MFELKWNMTEFASDQSLWPNDGADALVYSMDLGYVVANIPSLLGPHGACMAIDEEAREANR